MGSKGEAPELDTSGFLQTTDDDRIILGENRYGCFFKEDAAVVVAQFANAHQVMMKVRHYVAAPDGELLEEQFVRCKGNMRGATSGNNYNF